MGEGEKSQLSFFQWGIEEIKGSSQTSVMIQGVPILPRKLQDEFPMVLLSFFIHGETQAAELEKHKYPSILDTKEHF